MTRRVLVFGAAGQVGRALRDSCPQDITLIPFTSQEVDVRDEGAVDAAFADADAGLGAATIVNCAAWTNVGTAEKDPVGAAAVNTVAVEQIGRIAARRAVRMIHISTDYVFDGASGAPYPVTAPAHPLNVYGRTKLDGERRLQTANSSAVIVRSAWIHDGGPRNFISMAVRQLTTGHSMDAVDDQIGTPTRAANLAAAIWRIVERPQVTGVLHFTDAGVASWYDVAECVRVTLEEAGRLPADTATVPVHSGRFPRSAPRPRCAVLDKHECWTRIGWIPPHWRRGVTESVRELLSNA